jgi:hypothetical protein
MDVFDDGIGFEQQLLSAQFDHRTIIAWAREH